MSRTTLTSRSGGATAGQDSAEVWQNADGSVRVQFDPDGKVAEAFFVESQDAPLWQRLRLVFI